MTSTAKAPRGLVRVDPDPLLPKETEVAIIGGGIVGAAAAFYLARRGIPVCLFEKGEIGAEQSSRNWGWVRKMGRVEADIDLSILAETLWDPLAAQTGHRTGYRKIGGVYPCDTAADLDRLSDWVDKVARPRGLDSRLLTRAQLDALVPGGRRDFVGGLHTPSDGCAEPFWAAPALARGAQDHGAGIFTNCAVRGLERTAGAVTGVVTEHGTVACKSVILASGAWTRLFCKHLGLDFPQLRLMTSVMQTRPLDGLPDICFGASDFAFRKRADGGYTMARRSANTTYLTPDHFRYFFRFLPTLMDKRKLVQVKLDASFLAAWRDGRAWRDDQQTVFERQRILDAPPARAMLDQGMRNLVEAFPAFADIEEEQSWAGHIEGMPDALPVLSPVAALPGLVLASGFSGQGFGPGPAAGLVAAELATGLPPSTGVSQYSYDRFSGAARQGD